MTFWHWSRVTPYTSSCELAECCVFGKQSHKPLSCGRTMLRGRTPSQRRHPFSRSYGVNLPSSLTWFLSRSLVFSTLLPVSVYGTVTLSSTLRSFSSRRGISHFLRPKAPFAASLGLCARSFNPERPTLAAGHFQSPGWLSLPRPSIAPIRWCGNFDPLSIGYAFRPRLRIRLTLGGRTCPRKPWDFGHQDSHLVFRYSCLHGHLYAVHLRSLIGFDPHTTLFYHCE